jgi:hypothetical protein
VRRDRGEAYEPPPEHACTVDEGPIDIGVDPDRDERHVLYRKMHFYRGNLVWFSLQQSIVRGGENHIITRIDCCHGEVHRHVFVEGEGEVDRLSLVTIPPKGHAVVGAEFDRYLDEMTANWEAKVRAWRRT